MGGKDARIARAPQPVGCRRASRGSRLRRLPRWAFGLCLAATLHVGRADACVGDCSADANVTVDEIVQGVNIALGMRPLDECTRFDADGSQSVTVDEIIAAINSALVGCPQSTPTPAMSPTPTATRTASNLLFQGSIVDLFPHQVGDELKYRVTRLDGSVREETDRVASNASDGTFRVETISFTQRTEALVYRDTGATLLLVNAIDYEDDIQSVCQQPVLQLTTPIVRGDVRDDSTRCALRTLEGNRFLGNFIQVSKVTPMRSLDVMTVPAGTYADVIEIHSESNILNEQETARIWLAPGIGVIKSERSSFGVVDETRELIDGTIAGMSVRR